MATAQRTGGLDSPLSAPPSPVAALPRAALLIAGTLLIVVLYVAFDHGAVALAVATRAEVAIAVIAVGATAAWLTCDGARFPGSRAALGALGLLAGFAVWCGITVLWSVAPDQTWIEFNRAIAYALVAALALGVGATHRRAPEFVANGFLAVSLVVAVYALGQKLVPGLHVGGVFELNQTGAIPRLQEPIGYWNGLALFAVLGAPLGLRLAVDSRRTARSRLLAAGAVELLLLTVGLTLSRGGLLALAVAIIVLLTGAPERLRSLGWVVLTGLATLPALAYALTARALTTPGIPLSTREGAGAILAAILLASLAGLAFAGRRLISAEGRLVLSPSRAARVRWAGLVTLAILLTGGLLAAGLTHAWSGFTSPGAPSNLSPNRLLTTDSYRWLWWKEAANAFAARPLGGWGAGSFGVLHLIYRQNTLPVEQPHSLPLQFLSETGLVGGLLGLGALSLLLIAAARSARRSQTGRGTPTALLAGGSAYLVHGLYDWDWNIPAVTLPALLFLGVLAGSQVTTPGRAGLGQALPEPPGLGTRALALAVTTLGLCFFVASAVSPSLASSDARAALLDASSSARADLGAAQSQARRATSLDPLSDEGPLAEASVALHQGEFTRARYYVEVAVGRDPSDELAWGELAELDLLLQDRAGAREAARRVISLDPQGREAQGLRNLAGYGP